MSQVSPTSRLRALATAPPLLPFCLISEPFALDRCLCEWIENGITRPVLLVSGDLIVSKGQDLLHATSVAIVVIEMDLH